MKVEVLQSADDLKRILELKNVQECRMNHFEAGLFKGLIVKNDQDDQQLLGYLLYYFAYSTWQNRIVYIQEIWTRPQHPDQKELVVKLAKSLIEIAQRNSCNRININIALNSRESEWLAGVITGHELEFSNLGKKEDWLIFEMEGPDMLKFANDNSILVDQSKYQAVKVDDMSLYAPEVCELVREIAVFERMLEQFEMKPEILVRDYQPTETSPINPLTDKSGPYYQSWVLLEKQSEGQKPKVVGYTIYYVSYDLVKGIGCYLEELYMIESHRKKGLGKYLWKKTIQDCLETVGCNFMQWTVLNWNMDAINFYYKLNSKNLTDTCKLTLFRLVKEKIHSNQNLSALN